jgi:hypothetical protein
VAHLLLLNTLWLLVVVAVVLGGQVVAVEVVEALVVYCKPLGCLLLQVLL